MSSDDGQVLCWGEVLWDLFPDGRRLGGAPANVAVHLGTVGRDVALVSRVGDDALGAEAKAGLAARGVDTSLVQTDAECETGVVGVELVDGHARYTLEPGRAWERIECGDDVYARLANARAFCFGTLSQRKQPGRSALEQAFAALPQGCLRVVDPNLRPQHVDRELLRWSLGNADVVKINDDEARILERAFGVSDAAHWLHHGVGVTWVALTRGAGGCLLTSDDGESHDHPGVPVELVDSVGAGDAYTAVLTHMLLDLASAERANTAACHYAAYVASQRGATPAVPDSVIVRALGTALAR